MKTATLLLAFACACTVNTRLAYATTETTAAAETQYVDEIASASKRIMQEWINKLSDLDLKTKAQTLWTTCTEKYDEIKNAGSTDYTVYYESVLAYIQEILPSVKDKSAQRLTQIKELISGYLAKGEEATSADTLSTRLKTLLNANEDATEEPKEEESTRGSKLRNALRSFF